MKKALIIIGAVLLVACILITGLLVWQWPNITNQVNSALGNKVSSTVTSTIAPTSIVYDDNDSDEVGTDVCAVLTLDIAKQVLGNDAVKSSQNNGNCTYSSMTADGGFGVLVMVISSNPNSATARTSFDAARSTVYENKTESVSGLNVDDVYYATNLNQLSILEGSNWVLISGTSDKYTDDKDLAIATAKLIYK
jgi:hypothetical protein